MNINTLIIIVVTFAVGYLFAMFDRSVTQSFRKKREETPKPVAETPKDQNVAGEHTVLKVTVDPALKWHVELDGSRLEDPGAIAPEQRQRMVNVVVQMRPWIDGKPVPVAAPVPAPVPQPVPVQPIPAQPVPAPSPAPETPALRPIPASPVAQVPVQAPAAPPKIDAARGLRTLLKNEVKSPDKIKSTSIVTMIDDVLQAKIPGTAFAGKGIRLEEGSFGEVIVYVGASRYPGIDAVPDPEIQALIRSAIADWEKK